MSAAVLAIRSIRAARALRPDCRPVSTSRRERTWTPPRSTTTSWPPGWPRPPASACWRCASEGLDGRELKDAGDLAAHELLMELLAEHRPGDAVLSEEGKDDQVRLTADRVWIVDPLDGTREFSEPPRDDWAVHVALWERGELVAGAVAQPALGETFSTGAPAGRTSPHLGPARGSRSPAPARPAFVEALAAELDAELVPMGSAGVKVISVTRDVTDAYVHAGGQYEWDNAAPVAVARAAGLFCSRDRRLRAGLQPGGRLPARPHRLPPRAGRARSSTSSAGTAPTDGQLSIPRWWYPGARPASFSIPSARHAS